MLPEPKSGRQANARADALLSGGSDGYKDDALSIRVGDGRSFLWGEAESMNRGEAGVLGLAGHHVYDAVAGRQDGRHRFGVVPQRGAAAAMLPASTSPRSGRAVRSNINGSR
jgi:hypothetical protein